MNYTDIRQHLDDNQLDLNVSHQKFEEYMDWSNKTFKFIDGWLEIRMFDDRDVTYDIELDRIKSEGDLMRWALHLSRKNWVDRKFLCRFMEVVAEHKCFNIHN
jgi:hypothetical protein